MIKLLFSMLMFGCFMDYIHCQAAGTNPAFGDVRLVGGSSPNEGRVEIYYTSGWGTICDDNWGITDADVVCKQLGYVWALEAKSEAYFGQGSGAIYLDNVECFGSEQAIYNCNHAGVYFHNCGHWEDAGVVCETENVEPVDGLLRLSGGDDNASGLLDILYRGVWGSVCPEDFDMNDANAACKQLGFAWAIDFWTENDYSTCWSWITDIECDGTESSLLDCEHDGLYTQSCYEYESVYISCSDGDDPDIPEYLPVRLRNGKDDHDGRVEIYAEGEWGTICDKKWNIDDADVVCRQLGFLGALEAKKNAFYGQGRGPQHFKSFKCTGDENYLSDCPFSHATNSDTCNHSDDAGVVCHDEDDYTSGDYEFTDYPTYESSVSSECDPDMCINGYCFETSTITLCVCEAGWTGSGCDISTTACTPNPCVNGYCVSSSSSDSSQYICVCNSGWSGTNCDVATNPCDSNPCLNGQCTSLTSASSLGYTCLCSSGWTGTHCEIQMTACDNNPCVHGDCYIGTGSGSFYCSCNAGYTGDICDQVTSPCDPSPCVNGYCLSVTSATSDTLGYTCICNSGWTGNECDIATGPCDSNPCVNGICLSSAASGTSQHVCMCNSGWMGAQCDIATTVCDSNPCVNGICSTPDDPSQYMCICETGWTGAECNIEMTACDSNPCIHGDCLLEPNSNVFYCNCDDGYTGDICDQEIVGCGLEPCLNGGKCETLSDDGLQYKCDCLYGWIGTHCETERNGCNLNPCLNGMCADLDDGGYECKCTQGYSGNNCEIAETPCVPDPCFKGDCLIVPTDGTYFCNCYEGWTGEHCDEEVNLELECSSNPCLHGDCLELSAGGYICSCYENWTGDNCGTSTIGCVAEPCLNGGSCTDIGSNVDYECDCPAGFVGHDCQTVESFCDPDPCMNGMCLDIPNKMTFYCLCDENWSGDLCDMEIACVNNPCMNAVACIDKSDGTYTCICETGWIGDRCDVFESDQTTSRPDTTIRIAQPQTTEPVKETPDQQTSSELPLGIIAGAGGAALVIIIALIVLICFIRNRPSSSKPALSGVENQTYELEKPPVDSHDYDYTVHKLEEKSNGYIEPNGNLYQSVNESTYTEIPNSYMELSLPSNPYMDLIPSKNPTT